MSSNRGLVDLIERAHDAQPFCSSCGRPNRVRQRGGVVWVECPAAAAPGGRARRLVAWLLPHDRRRVVDVPFQLLA